MVNVVVVSVLTPLRAACSASSMLLIGLALLMTGCLSQSKIQSKYIAAQDECRSQSQDALDRTPNKPPATTTVNSPADDKNSAMVALFSDCMNKAGWHVAVPKPATPLPQTPVAQNPQNPPTGVFPSTPPAVSSVAARPATQLPSATPAASGAAVTTSPVIGPGVTPNSQPATGGTPPAASYQAAPPASYQPTAPVETPYGSGAGRQF